jgi:hypothetical protein
VSTKGSKRLRLLSKPTTCLLAWCALLACAASAADIYVASNGNDSWDGSSGAPLRNIKTAISRAVYGDTIRVRAGTYNESWIVAKSGLTIVSEDGLYAARIYSNTASGLRFTGVSNCEARGFECFANYGQGSAGDGLVRIYNSDNIRLRDLLCHDASYDCDVIKIGGFGTNTTNTLVENCVIYNPAPTAAGSIAECLDAHPVNGLIVRNCWIYHTAARKGETLIRANGGSQNVTWVSNVFGPSVDNGAHSPATTAGTVDSDTPQVPSVDSLTARNNLFLSCQGSGAFSVISSRNVRFYNNTIWNYLGADAAVSFRNTSSSGNQSLDFCNNVLCNNNGRPAFVALGAYTPGTFTHDYNLYWQVAPGGLVDVTAEPHSLQADPLLASAATPLPDTDTWLSIVGRFRPLPVSVTIDAGMDLGSLVPTDVNGVARPIDQFDIGPYEVLVGDVTADGYVDAADLLVFAAGWGKSTGDGGFNPSCDFNGDNRVDVSDLLALAGRWGR